MFNSPKESENYNISKNGSEYNINFIYSNSSLEIKIADKEPFTKSTYQKIFSLEELAKVSIYFSLFKTISDIKPNIKTMISDEKSRDLEVNKNANLIKLILIPQIMNIGKIIFELPKNNVDKDEIIQELVQSNISLLKRVEYLEKEVKDIKEIIESNNIKKIKYNIIDSSIIHNSEENKFIIDCIGKNNLTFKKLYKMSVDGEKEAFHKKCDNQGPTLCLFKIKDKDIRYGGFASVSWNSEGHEIRDENAFIFSINKRKMFKSTNYDSSLYCRSDYGPFFGGNSNVNYAELWFNTKNSCGFYNQNVYKDINKECTGGLNDFTLDELEVFSVINF